MPRTTSEEVKHKRAVQGAMSIGTATIGLAALGSKGGSMALKKYPKALKGMKNIDSQKLNSASISLTTAGAGLGGMSGYHFAALQRAENKAERERDGKVNKMLEYSPFGVVTKANWKDTAGTAQGAGYVGALGGVGTALAAPDINRYFVGRSKAERNKTRKTAYKRSDAANSKAMRNISNNREMASALKDEIKFSRENRDFSEADRSIRQGQIADIETDVQQANKKNVKGVLRAQKKIFKPLKQAEKNLKATKSRFSTPKIAAVALGAGGLSLAGSEMARQAKKEQVGKWWSGI